MLRAGFGQRYVSFGSVLGAGLSLEPLARSSCRSPPAARPTSMRASSARAPGAAWASRSWSTTAPAPARSSAPTPSPRAAPDGYTLLLMSNTHTVNESLIPNKPFELMRDFAPVAPINYSDLVLVVHPRCRRTTLRS